MCPRPPQVYQTDTDFETVDAPGMARLTVPRHVEHGTDLLVQWEVGHAPMHSRPLCSLSEFQSRALAVPISSVRVVSDVLILAPCRRMCIVSAYRSLRTGLGCTRCVPIDVHAHVDVAIHAEMHTGEWTVQPHTCSCSHPCRDAHRGVDCTATSVSRNGPETFPCFSQCPCNRCL